MASVLEAVEPYSLALFSRVLGYTFEQTHALMFKVKKDVLNPANHLYTGFHYIYGRKPLK
jgi:hypothetical protein